jgi:cell wall-associated NlpC family hydrolase
VLLSLPILGHWFSGASLAAGNSEAIAQLPVDTADGTSSRAANRTLGAKVLGKALTIFQHCTANEYAHTPGKADDQVVDNGDGTSNCATDCSGFVSYVLKAVAKKHYELVVDFAGGHRPRANRYAQFFAQLSSDPINGWLKVPSVQALAPGDLIAWESPSYEEHHKGNSGHVMIVSAAPGAVQEELIAGQTIRYISIPVIDSSSVRHFAPEQLPPKAHQTQRDGLGMGTVRIILDAQNNDKPVGYWEGTFWGEGQKVIRKPTLSNNVSFGRLVGFRESE